MLNDLSVTAITVENFYTAVQSFCPMPYTLFFDSSDPLHKESNWSLLCYDPIETIIFKNNIVRWNGDVIDSENPFDFVQSRLEQFQASPHAFLPFCGGAAGYFGYDMGRCLETLPQIAIEDLNLPDMVIGIYQSFMALDHKTGRAWRIGEEKKVNSEPSSRPLPKVHFEPEISDNDFLSGIKKVIDLIHQGEVYQVNLSRRFKAYLPDGFDPFLHYYSKLRGINPAPFSSFMNFGEFQLASSSPERFLHCKNGQVETRPIKGTLPSHCPQEDLLNSEKDRAENLMIVDLLRNDLSKVCEMDSVHVPSLFAIETFKGLHHMVSTICGILPDGKTSIDLIKACFPGGSITGAPKIRAMEIIEQLEPTRRGAYCGTMGYIGFDRALDTNIMIRTIIYKDNKAFLQVGSGIVSDSDPKKELEETNHKIQKILESFA